MDNSLLGWYKTQDNSGGNLKRLVYEGEDDEGNAIYSDDRAEQDTQRYYYKSYENEETKEMEWPTAFKPLYNSE